MNGDVAVCLLLLVPTFCKVVLNKKQLPFWASRFVVVCLTLCNLVPIRELFPLWIICACICLVLFILSQSGNSFLIETSSNTVVPYPLCRFQFSFLPSDVDINLGLLLLRLCSFDEAVCLFPD